jgi:hypothetical protein
MHKNHTKGILAIGIICLFIGVGIHPAFAVETRQSIVNKASEEDCGCNDEFNKKEILYLFYHRRDLPRFICESLALLLELLDEMYHKLTDLGFVILVSVFKFYIIDFLDGIYTLNCDWMYPFP